MQAHRPPSTRYRHWRWGIGPLTVLLLLLVGSTDSAIGETIRNLWHGILQLLDRVTWPIAVVVAILVLRNRLTDLLSAASEKLRRLASLKVKDSELGFIDLPGPPSTLEVPPGPARPLDGLPATVPSALLPQLVLARYHTGYTNFLAQMLLRMHWDSLRKTDTLIKVLPIIQTSAVGFRNLDSLLEAAKATYLLDAPERSLIDSYPIDDMRSEIRDKASFLEDQTRTAD